MRTFRTIAGTALPLLACLVSCGGGDKPSQEAEQNLVIGDEQPASARSLYQMPTPNELFDLVREMAGDGQKRLMNPAVNADRYASLGKRALNFGVYSTDLIYASYFDLNVEVVRYYLKVKDLGDGLGLTAAFAEGDFRRLESNVTRRNNDSIRILSDDAYYRAYEQLHSENMGVTLALALAGGWVESMHLVTQQVQKFDPNDALVRRAADQKVTLEHLIDMIEPNAADSTLAPVQQRLLAIRDIYDRFPVTRKPHEGRTGSGRMVLGDDATIEVSEENFKALAEAVEALRNEIIMPEQPASVNTNS